MCSCLLFWLNITNVCVNFKYLLTGELNNLRQSRKKEHKTKPNNTFYKWSGSFIQLQPVVTSPSQLTLSIGQPIRSSPVFTRYSVHHLGPSCVHVCVCVCVHVCVCVRVVCACVGGCCEGGCAMCVCVCVCLYVCARVCNYWIK